MTEKRIYFYEEEISRLASVMHRELVNKINSVIPDGGINISHLIIMEFLKEKKSSNMSDLSKTLKLTMGAATVIIDKMVELKLTKRHHSKADRRVVEVELTDRGKAVAGKFVKQRLVIIKEVFSVLTEADKRIYLKLITQIYNGLKSKNEKK
ncbi:MAG: MarR family transcriptional regulator [Dehalococcoidia bacterium]|nr:MAG: MarR family transcriptional regulator [Dehalococcoidia bacterium]